MKDVNVNGCWLVMDAAFGLIHVKLENVNRASHVTCDW